MDDKTLTALKASIAHWEDNLVKAKAGEEFSTFAEDCALCAKFAPFSQSIEKDCVACPVAKKTGLLCCEGTPYCDVSYAQREDEDCAAVVEAELDFLKSLLPEVKP